MANACKQQKIASIVVLLQQLLQRMFVYTGISMLLERHDNCEQSVLLLHSPCPFKREFESVPLKQHLLWEANLQDMRTAKLIGHASLLLYAPYDLVA